MVVTSKQQTKRAQQRALPSTKAVITSTKPTGSVETGKSERSDEDRRDDASGSEGEGQGLKRGHEESRQDTSSNNNKSSNNGSNSHPKKRRKTWKDWKNEVVSKPSEQREAPETRKNSASSTAFETLMNVAALVQPLPEPKGGKKKMATKTPIKRAMSDVSATGSTKSNGDVVSNQSRWESMFAKLKAYKEAHGTCNVPNRFPQDPALGSWVATQRRYYKSQHLPMPEDRVKLLTDLGMEWSTKDPRKVPWMTRYQGLKEFMEKHGHCDVPHEYPANQQLGFWVANQRQQYRYLQLGRKSALNEERIQLLNEISFCWKLSGGRKRKSTDGSESSAGSPAALKNEPSAVASAVMPKLLLNPETVLSPKGKGAVKAIKEEKEGILEKAVVHAAMV